MPITYPKEIPAMIQMRSGEKQLWRVVNASADTQLNLQLLFDCVPQPLQIVDWTASHRTLKMELDVGKSQPRLAF